MIDGHVIRDGRRVVENYIRPCTVRRKCTYPKQLRVPKGEYFLLGDNRGASSDSRLWGPVQKKWILGTAFATYWPPGRIGLL